MKAITKPTLTRKLLATAMAGVLVFSLGSSYASTVNKTDETKNKASQEQILTDNQTLDHYAGWQDPDMARVAEHEGRAMLNHIEAAHAALQEHKTGEARAALRAAEDFAEGLQLMAPYTVVVDNIHNAKSSEPLAKDTSIAVNDMLPIYSSFDEMSEYTPNLANSAKTKINQAVRHMRKGADHKVAQKLDEIATEISSYTVYIPVNYVENQIESALAALNMDQADTQTANQAIDNAMQSLVQSTVNMHFFPKDKSTVQATPGTHHPSGNGSS